MPKTKKKHQRKEGENCKGKPSGSGTVSDKRRELFKARSLQRELSNMSLEDKNVLKSKSGKRLVKLLTQEEIDAMFDACGKKKEEGEEKEGGVDKTLPSGSVDKTQASSSSQKQKKEASVDKTQASSSSQQLKREASVDKTQASGIVVKTMVADYEEKHTAPPKLKRGPLDGVERMTPALAAWEEQKLKLQARLQQQKEVERIAREAAGVFEPDWGASSSSSSSSSSPGVQNQKKKKTGTPAKGLETGSFDKREPEGSFDKREPAATSSASFDKRGALDVTPLLRTPQRWRKTNRHRIAVDWFNTTYLASCNGVPPQNVEALQKLNSHGFNLVLLSYCGWKREQEVKYLAWGLPVPWALHFTRSKAGVDGKCAWLEHLHCGRIIDDDVEVLWEAQEKGYQYYAIQTPKKRHEWCRRGAYPGLPEAVEAILAGQ